MSVYEMIVCRDERQAKRIRQQVSGNPNIRVVSATHPSQIFGFSPQRITVCEGVDLYQPFHGEGRLVDLLRARQLTCGDRAVFIVL